MNTQLAALEALIRTTQARLATARDETIKRDLRAQLSRLFDERNKARQ